MNLCRLWHRFIWSVKALKRVCRVATLQNRRAASHLSHCIQHIGPCWGAGGQGLQGEGGGKMRRAALEADFKELAVIAFAERRHGTGYFFLALWPGADHYRGQSFELPAWPFDFRFGAATREPAEILHLQRERRRTIQICLKS